LARRIQQNLPPSPPKYPASAPSIGTSPNSRGVIFIEGNPIGAALQGQPAFTSGYLLLAQNGDFLVNESGNYLEIDYI